MTTTTKRGFHLPWGNDDHDPDADGSAAAAAAPLDPAAESTKAGSARGSASPSDSAGGVRSALRNGPIDELGRGPFDLAPSPSGDADARPGESTTDDLVDNDEVRRRLPDRGVPDGGQASAEAPGEPNLAWPDVDRAGSSTHLASDSALPPVRPAVVVKGDAGRSGRRDNSLVVGLVKAMRDAARATRQETTSRMRVAATARIDEIRASAAVEAVSLRKRADEDVAAIREWSKAEMARIRDEAEQRISGRKAQLAREAMTSTSEIERVIDEVKSAAAAFEADMERFFEILLAEEDPARLATLAERVPEAPVFAKLSPVTRSSGSGRGGTNGRPKPVRQRTAAGRRPTVAREPAPPEPGYTGEGDSAETRLEPDAAAAAEAEAIAGLDIVAPDSDPAAEANAGRSPESSADTSPQPSPDPSPEPSPQPSADTSPQPSPDPSPDDGGAHLNEWGSGSLAGFLATAPRIDSPDDLSPEERIRLLGLDVSDGAELSETEQGAPTQELFSERVTDAAGPVAAVAEPLAEPLAEPVPELNAQVPSQASPVEQQTKLVVTGLTSVAGISAFKGALNRVPGVTSVSVTSGHEEDFIFAVNHQGGTDLRRAVTDFQGFSAQMTFDDGSIINWTVSEPGA